MIKTNLAPNEFLKKAEVRKQILKKAILYIDDKEFTCTIKLRYRFRSTPCKVRIEEDNAYISLDEAAFGVTDGQLAVFYDNDKVLGSGWIQSTE